MKKRVVFPQLGLTMSDGTINEWLKNEGDDVQKGEPLFVVETEKAMVEVEATAGGNLAKIITPVGVRVPVGQTVAFIVTEGEVISGEDIAEASNPSPVEAGGAGGSGAPAFGAAEAGPSGDAAVAEGIKASPLAKRLAREHGIDLSTLKGSGPGGRIVKEDVEAAISAKAAVANNNAFTGGAGPDSAAMATSGADSQEMIVPLSTVKRITGERVTDSFRNVPHFYLTIDIDADRLADFRESLVKASDLSGGVRVSYTDIIVKAVARSLAAHPEMNASFSGEGIRRQAAVNVGVAMDTPNGLVVPVVKNADALSLNDVARQTRVLREKAAAGRLMPGDFALGTFTVSNLGMFGIDSFHAIINPPEAGILAVGQMRQVPVVKSGALVVGWRASLTLSCDHRVVDGAQGARFMATLRRYLENPVNLVL
ncbi:MAG: 2-oxo acid dehydrogenase subunit E2 [Firmicutes bacterium]|nr:2-oxo acid dehydrogenase subunit E2 [Bacillota bacterium]